MGERGRRGLRRRAADPPRADRPRAGAPHGGPSRGVAPRGGERRGGPGGKWRGPAVAALLALQAAVLAGIFQAPPGSTLVGWYAITWVLFGAAVWASRGVPGPAAGRLVLAGGLAVIATGLLGPPATSTDSFRYAWDGRVQSAGISPYDHAPADPALASLRDPWLFPRCSEGHFYPIEGGACTRINRPSAHTIYPPLAEAYFMVVDRLSPGDARHKPLQVAGALLAAGTLLVLLRGNDARRAACWAWCPAVPMEAVNNAHVDMLAVAAVVLALGGRAGPSLRGALLGGAIAVKLVPAVVLPGALSGALSGAPSSGRAGRRAVWTTVLAVLVVAAAYLPYVLVSRGSVLGYLSGYVAEEGYDEAGARGRYGLLRLVLPDSWAVPAVVLVMAAVTFHVVTRGDPDRPWRGALVVTGTAFLLLTPGYPWYALLIVALVALDGRWEWLGVPLAGAVAYLAPEAGTPAYAAAGAAVLAGAVLRRSRTAPVGVARGAHRGRQ
ncbi:glycosyltransferase 87 family protein [Nonomuraea sp. KM88]|uniref:glycosyltransferase 87 family protein n=1 Tax=Nonomuraea sp. KM88 TaxID=3457427 RepID=UPI003FCC65AA